MYDFAFHSFLGLDSGCLVLFRLVELIVLFLDLLKLEHVLIKVLALVQSDQQLGLLCGSGGDFLVLLFVSIGPLDGNGLGLKLGIFSVPIPDEAFGCNDSNGGSVTKCVHDYGVMLLQDLLSEEDVE